MPDDGPVERRSPRRSVTWCCGSRARIRAGASSGSSARVAGVGVGVSAATVAKILRQAGVSPAGARTQLSWREFLRVQAESIIACDFFTVDTLWLGRLYLLFLLELSSRRVHFAGCSANPDGRWLAQQARQLACSLTERATPARFLIHDRKVSSTTPSTTSSEAKASGSSAPHFALR